MIFNFIIVIICTIIAVLIGDFLVGQPEEIDRQNR